MANITRISFFQTSAFIDETLAAAKVKFETTHPDRRFVKGQIVAASPGDSNGDRWIDIEVTWTAA